MFGSVDETTVHKKTGINIVIAINFAAALELSVVGIGGLNPEFTPLPPLLSRGIVVGVVFGMLGLFVVVVAGVDPCEGFPPAVLQIYMIQNV